MSKYINDSMTNSDLEQSLSQSKVYPLVQELSMLFGLEVSNRILMRSHDYDDYIRYRFRDDYEDKNYNKIYPQDDSDSFVEAFVMTMKGIPQVVVYFNDKAQTYNVYHRQTVKERGKDSWDRKTISSRKISQIIKTIHKKEIPSYHYHENRFTWGKDSLIKDYKYEDKTLDVYKDDMHRHERTLTYDSNSNVFVKCLVRSIYGDKKPLTHETDKYFKDFVDKSNLLCHAYESAKEEVESEVANGFYAIGITNGQGFIMGDYDVKVDSKQQSYFEMKNTQLVREIEDISWYESIQPLLTMLKIKLEDKDVEIERDFWFNRKYKAWIEELGVLYLTSEFGDVSDDPFSIKWLLISKGEQCNTEESKEE